MKKKGFTLIELLVVIAIIALLVSILMPGLSRARELAKRASCGSNTSSVGKAIALYQGSYKDAYPWIRSTNWDSEIGTAAMTVPPLPSANADARSIGAILFLLVRDGQSTGIFTCPSADSDKAAENKGTTYVIKDAYDFEDGENLSYSYQYPLVSGTAWTNGVTGRSNSQVAIMADSIKTLTDRSKLAIAWSTVTDKKVIKAALSQNHTAGEYINVLYADSHVGNGAKGDLGFSKDSIYTNATTDEDGYLQDNGTTSGANHTSINDSFLFSPADSD